MSIKVNMELLYSVIDCDSGKVLREVSLSTHEGTDWHGIPRIKDTLISDCKMLEGIISGLV